MGLILSAESAAAPGLGRSRMLPVLALALVTRSIWAWPVPINPVSDCVVYDKVAMNLAEGLGYCFVPGHPTALWPVGTSFLLSRCSTGYSRPRLLACRGIQRGAGRSLGGADHGAGPALLRLASRPDRRDLDGALAVAHRIHDDPRERAPVPGGDAVGVGILVGTRLARAGPGDVGRSRPRGRLLRPAYRAAAPGHPDHTRCRGSPTVQGRGSPTRPRHNRDDDLHTPLVDAELWDLRRVCPDLHQCWREYLDRQQPGIQWHLSQPPQSFRAQRTAARSPIWEGGLGLHPQGSRGIRPAVYGEAGASP